MIQAINCNHLYSETTIFSQGIVADEFTFLAADARQRDGSVHDRKREHRSAVKRLKLCTSLSIRAARIYRTW